MTANFRPRSWSKPAERQLEGNMSRYTATLMLALMSACATQADTDDSAAIDDFIAISDLHEVRIVRTLDDFDYDALTDRYVIVEARRDYYLVELYGRCRELMTEYADIQPDIRPEAKAIRTGEDTIRGCRIKAMYEIDKVQAMELNEIGEAPAE